MKKTVLVPKCRYRHFGTSLSKAYHVIDRFSEDIDITFAERIGESRRKKLKYNVMKPISEQLNMKIANWDKIESDKDYNYYDFAYSPTTSVEGNVLKPYVKVETALMSYAYPTEERQISSIVYEYLKDDNMDIIKEYDLEPFEMKVQTLTRTFMDKLFAVCDYYIKGKAARNSRHLYDIYKLYPHMVINDEFRILLGKVRKQRAEMADEITPSARAEVDIVQIADELRNARFYAKDYEDTTMKLSDDSVGYKEAIELYSGIIHELF